MDPLSLGLAGGSLLFKGLGALFGHKSKSKANDEQRRAQIAALTLAQKQREDARRARLELGSSILNRVPATTAGGRVNTNVALDPELVKKLGMERTYDFGSAVPNENAGASSAFLSGLFGGAGDLATSMYQPQGQGGNGIQGIPLAELLRLSKTQGGDSGYQSDAYPPE